MSLFKRGPKFDTYIRLPHSAVNGYSAAQVAKAYNLPTGFDGTGVTVGIIELGGAYNAADLTALGGIVGVNLDPTNVTVVEVQNTAPVSDGPNGADGEVALDVQVVAQTAPGSKIRVYSCPNTDSGFCAGIVQATAECDVISISWGQAENGWSAASVKQFEAAFAAARAKGVPVFAASGDSGSTDGTRTNQTDYPASSPNVVGCGGTRLTLNPDGSRLAEVAWDDNPTSSATGGGISKLFPGRQVPDVAGNADPVTGWTVVVDGHAGVIGGTSAVAPWYAGAWAVLLQATKKAKVDFLNTVTNNPTVAFDVVSGSNGAFRAGPGRDDVTGIGVVDFGKLYALLSGGTVTPTPTPTPTPVPTPAPSGDVTFEVWLRSWVTATSQATAYMDTWLKTHNE